jgi:WD40 repeat protein
VHAADSTIWDVADPARPHQLSAVEGGSLYQQGASVSPDGSRLAAVNKGVTAISDITDRRAPRLEFRLDTPGATVVSFTAGNATLVTGDETGALRVWRRDGAQFRQLGSARRHTGAIGGIGAHPRQPWIATGGQDGTVRLWDLTDPAHPAELAVYNHGGLYAAASIWFSRDGKTLATADASSIRLWNVDLDDTLNRLCDLSADITPDEWSAYLPGRPYDPPCR